MKSIRLNTPLLKIKTKTKLHIINEILKWVISNSNFKYPSDIYIKVYNYRRSNGCVWGEYDFKYHKISIYINNIPTVKHLIETVLHEFKHSSQKEERYALLCTKHAYSRHPHEKSACRFAKNNSSKCWNKINTVFKA